MSTRLRYHIYPKYSDRQTWANSVDPDQMLQNAASDLGLHCLDSSSNSYTKSTDSRNGLVQMLGQAQDGFKVSNT